MTTKYKEIETPTPNVYSDRTNEIKGVIFHHTVFDKDRSVAWLTDRRSQVSAHVVIDTDGTRYILADDDKITWHAGKSAFKGRKWCNGFMLGVEFVGNTLEEPLTEEQIESAVEWLKPRWIKYGFTLDWITDHRTVSPGRKVDIEKKELRKLKMRIASEFLGGRVKPKDLQEIPVVIRWVNELFSEDGNS